MTTPSRNDASGSAATAKRPISVLLVEDSPDEAALVVLELQRGGFDVRWDRVDSARGVREAIQRQPWDVVISDFAMPSFDGLTAFRIVQRHNQDLPFIFVSGVLGEDRAVEALRHGARDYVLKGNLARLIPAVNRELAEAAERRQRRDAEQALRVQERRYRTIFDSAAVALAELDFSPVRQWLERLRERGLTDLAAYLHEHRDEAAAAAAKVRVHDANEAMARLLGAPDRRQLLDGFVSALRPPSGPAWTALLEAFFERRPRLQIETEATCGGHTVPVLLSAQLPPPEDAGEHLIVSMLDISEQRNAAERTREAQRLETVGRLAGGVAHDFNNLLAVIGSFAAILRDELPDRADAQRDLEVILDATRRGAALTGQLLAFSRRQLQELQLVDLNAVILDLKAILRRLISEDIELSWHLGSELGLVRADPSQMEQVLMNLVVNARDAMPAGGRLTVETASMNVGPNSGPPGLAAGAWVRLSIEDTGIGMDEATRLRIFEPFFTTKDPGKGTGMGLATVYGIIKQSGGQIEVQSAPRQGTRFDMYLPRVSGTASATPRVRPGAPARRGTETILLVEDDDLVRRAARRILESQGYLVLEAANGPDALVLARRSSRPIDLLLTDLVMPKMNGEALAKELAVVVPRLKVIFLSGYDAHAPGASLAGVGHGYLRKPFTPAALTAKIREALDAPGPQNRPESVR